MIVYLVVYSSIVCYKKIMLKNRSDFFHLLIVLLSWFFAFFVSKFFVGFITFLNEFFDAVQAAHLSKKVALELGGQLGQEARKVFGISLDAWVQAIASILGAVLSGLVAAVVAVFIVRHEQRVREAERVTREKEREQDRIEREEEKLNTIMDTLDAVSDWIRDIYSVIKVKTDSVVDALVKDYDGAGPEIYLAVEELRKLQMPSELKARVAQTYPKLSLSIVSTCKDIGTIEERLAGKIKTLRHDGKDRYLHILKANDLQVIGGYIHVLGINLKELSRQEPYLEYVCERAAEFLAEAGNKWIAAKSADRNDPFVPSKPA